MSTAHQTPLPFGPAETERKRADFPWGAAEARRDAHKQQTSLRKGKMYARILEYVHNYGDFTVDELVQEWECSPNHVAPRVTELLKLGRLAETGAKRKTRSGGWAAVLREAN